MSDLHRAVAKAAAMASYALTEAEFTDDEVDLLTEFGPIADAVLGVVHEHAETVWLCGTRGNYRKGKSLDLTCVFVGGHYESCGRYSLVALGGSEKP